REQVDQSNALSHDSDERIDVPHRFGTVPDGRRGAPRFLFCHGGGSCGRNVLQFWHCSTDRRGLEQVLRWAGKSHPRRIRSREARGGSSREEIAPCLTN